MATRKKYSKEFKLDAVSLAVIFKLVVASIYPVFVNSIFSFSGFRNTELGSSQFRVLPLQRSGCFALAAA